MKHSTLLIGITLLSTLFVWWCFNSTTPSESIVREPQQEQVVSTGSITGSNDTTTQTGSDITSSDNTITLADIANHKTESDCRTAINGTVYDVTAFFGKHPGGDKNLFRVCGIDATEVFNKKHGNDPKANNVLAGFEIGTLTQ